LSVVTVGRVAPGRQVTQKRMFGDN